MGTMVSEIFDPARWRAVDGFNFTDITYHRALDSGTVRVAFVDGMDASLVVAACIAGVGLLLTLVFLPSRATPVAGGTAATAAATAVPPTPTHPPLVAADVEVVAE